MYVVRNVIIQMKGAGRMVAASSVMGRSVNSGVSIAIVVKIRPVSLIGETSQQTAFSSLGGQPWI